MAGQLKKIAGPAFIANAATDIYTPPASTIYTVIKHIIVANHTGVAANFTLYVGGTGGSAAGTDIMGLSKNVPANDYVEKFFSPGLKLLSTDFLSGIASAASTLVITVMGEQNVV